MPDLPSFFSIGEEYGYRDGSPQELVDLDGEQQMRKANHGVHEALSPRRTIGHRVELILAGQKDNVASSMRTRCESWKRF